MTDPSLRTRLDVLHARLLQLHRALLDETKRTYEATHGRIGGPAALLQLVTGDAAFEWLRPLSRMVIDLEDVGLDAAAQGAARTLVASLFDAANPFQVRLAELATTQRPVAVAYADTLGALEALPASAG